MMTLTLEAVLIVTLSRSYSYSCEVCWTVVERRPSSLHLRYGSSPLTSTCSCQCGFCYCYCIHCSCGCCWHCFNHHFHHSHNQHRHYYLHFFLVHTTNIIIAIIIIVVVVITMRMCGVSPFSSFFNGPIEFSLVEEVHYPAVRALCSVWVVWVEQRAVLPGICTQGWCTQHRHITVFFASKTPKYFPDNNYCCCLPSVPATC